MKYLYQDLTEKIIGLIFGTYNHLKFGYQEKYYQRAFELLLKENRITYQKELLVPITFKEKIIGRYFIDFVIENRLAVEFKVGKEQYIQQVVAYLKANNLKLGLIALLTQKGVRIKRIIN